MLEVDTDTSSELIVSSVTVPDGPVAGAAAGVEAAACVPWSVWVGGADSSFFLWNSEPSFETALEASSAVESDALGALEEADELLPPPLALAVLEPDCWALCALLHWSPPTASAKLDLTG